MQLTSLSCSAIWGIYVYPCATRQYHNKYIELYSTKTLRCREINTIIFNIFNVLFHTKGRKIFIENVPTNQ